MRFWKEKKRSREGKKRDTVSYWIKPARKERRKALLRALLLLQSVCLINAETGPDHFVCLSRFFMAETDPLSFSKTPRKKMQKSPTREENACGYIR